MNFETLGKYIAEYQESRLKYFVTCSFQSHSLVLLHMLSRIDPHIQVVFIDTGYHFPETIKFRDEVIDTFGLTNLISLRSAMPKSMQMDSTGRLLYTSDTDHCCYINKTEPLNSVLRTHDVWVNGVRKDQSAFRSTLTETQAKLGEYLELPKTGGLKTELEVFLKEFSF